MAFGRRVARAVFLSITLAFLGTAFFGWSLVVSAALRGRNLAPWFVELTDLSSAVAVALLTAVLVLKEVGVFRDAPRIPLRIVAEPTEDRPAHEGDPWSIEAVVSVPVGTRPIRLRTLTGRVEPLYEGEVFTSSPVLLKPEPEALDVAIKRFQVSVREPGLPCEGKTLRVTVFLVADEVTAESVLLIGPGGRYWTPRILERIHAAWWLRKQERRRARAWRRGPSP